MRTFDQWLIEEHQYDESLLGRAFSNTIDFIDTVIEKAEKAAEYLRDNAKNWGRKGRDKAVSGVETGVTAALDGAKFAVHNPGTVAKNVALAVPKAMWFTFKKMRARYGLAQAIGIMAVCVAMHVAFPPLIVMPASSVIGASPGMAVAETWHQIHTSNSLLRRGIHGIAHLLRLDRGIEALTPERIKELGREAYEEVQEAIEKAAAA